MGVVGVVMNRVNPSLGFGGAGIAQSMWNLSRENDNWQRGLFNRRAGLILGGKTLLMGLLAARLYNMQVVERERFQLLAEENRLKLQLLVPTRGRVFDRNGYSLATNYPTYRVVIIPEHAKQVEAVLASLGRVIALSAEDIEAAVEQSKRIKQFVPILVRANLSWEEVSRVELYSARLPGVQIDSVQQRVYPQGRYTAHVVGFVGAVDKESIGRHQLFALPGFKLGKQGLERSFEDALRGIGGRREVEVDASGRVIKEIKQKRSRPGKALWVSIDLPLQRSITHLLERYRRASCVVMDIYSGEVLALVSVPAGKICSIIRIILYRTRRLRDCMRRARRSSWRCCWRRSRRVIMRITGLSARGIWTLMIIGFIVGSGVVMGRWTPAAR